MELGPHLAIFNLRIMYGMKRVIVFALKNNDELIVCKKRVTASVRRNLFFLSAVCSTQARAVRGNTPPGPPLERPED